MDFDFIFLFQEETHLENTELNKNNIKTKEILYDLF